MYVDYYNLKSDLEHLFSRYNLINLWDDTINNIISNLNSFFKYECGNFIKVINKINNAYNVHINISQIKMVDNFWCVKFAILNSTKKGIIKIPFVKWNFDIEKENKYQNLILYFDEEIKKFNKVKKYLLNNKPKKVLLYPIENVHHPIYELSQEIKKSLLNKNHSTVHLIKMLEILNICSVKKALGFFKFLNISESRFITKLRDEIIPFIKNIHLLNNRKQIKKIYYFDSPDFIIETVKGAIGVEVTNIRNKNDYYNDRCYRENILRKLINSKCFYSKKYVIAKQYKNFAYKQKANKRHDRIKSVVRHFSNNQKYNHLIRENGLKVRRGQKNFYILNGWNKTLSSNEIKLIKNIAIRENIPLNRLIFFSAKDLEKNIN